MSVKTGDSIKIIAVNRKARHYYEIQDTMEAGMVLTGPEVKSLRGGKVNFKDGYVRFSGNYEAFLCGVHISPYENASNDQDPDRERKLLLHEHQIRTWKAKTEQKGLTVVPMKIYLKRGKMKLEIGLAKGKNVHDRKDALKERDLNREAKREKDRYK